MHILVDSEVEGKGEKEQVMAMVSESEPVEEEAKPPPVKEVKINWKNNPYPIFTFMSGGKPQLENQLNLHIATDATKDKTELVEIQRTLYYQGRYEEFREKLKNVKTYDGLVEAFGEPQDADTLALIQRLKDHVDWLFKDSTWSWMSNFQYIAPPLDLREKLPVMFEEGSTFSFRCGVCAKGVEAQTECEEHEVTRKDHENVRAHMEHQLRWINLYGGTLPEEAPLNEQTREGKCQLNLDERNDDVQPSVEPIAEGDVPTGFKTNLTPTDELPAFVCFSVILNHEAKSVKVTSSAIKIGPKLKEKDTATKKSAHTFVDFFRITLPKPAEKAHRGYKHNYRPTRPTKESWRTLAIPIEKSAWVNIEIDGDILHQEYVEKPAPGQVLTYVIDNTTPVAPRDRKSWPAKQSWKEKPEDLREFLEKSYRDVKPACLWPIQVLSPSNKTLISVLVYMTESEEEEQKKKEEVESEWKMSGWMSPKEYHQAKQQKGWGAPTNGWRQVQPATQTVVGKAASRVMSDLGNQSAWPTISASSTAASTSPKKRRNGSSATWKVAAAAAAAVEHPVTSRESPPESPKKIIKHEDVQQQQDTRSKENLTPAGGNDVKCEKMDGKIEEEADHMEGLTLGSGNRSEKTDKKDIIMYLHGDQDRYRSNCRMPGIPTYLWPECNGPIKYAMGKGKKIMQGKICVTPMSHENKYWVRHPNVHDSDTFVPDMAAALLEVRNVAAKWCKGNEDRFFLTGMSMGGYGCLELAAYWGPKIVKGCVAACPSHDANRQVDYFVPRLREVPLWVVHSRMDVLCRWEETASLMLRLQESRPRAIRLSSEGSQKIFLDHSRAGEIYQDAEPYKWMDLQ